MTYFVRISSSGGGTGTYSFVAEALDAPTDILVDYTNAEVVKSNVMTAVNNALL